MKGRWIPRWRPKQAKKRTCNTCTHRKERFNQESMAQLICRLCLTSGQAFPHWEKIKEEQNK